MIYTVKNRLILDMLEEAAGFEPGSLHTLDTLLRVYYTIEDKKINDYVVGLGFVNQLTAESGIMVIAFSDSVLDDRTLLDKMAEECSGICDYIDIEVSNMVQKSKFAKYGFGLGKISVRRKI